MPNPAHLDVLLQGVNAWNTWRSENADVEPDLSAARLIDADLNGAALAHANLTAADLSGANLSGADLTGANLREANLSEANVRGALLREADLTGASVPGADWQDADLTDARLDRALLNRSQFEAANESARTRFAGSAECLARLDQGVDAWNAWRLANETEPTIHDLKERNRSDRWRA